jgi:hypothetical protein
MAIAAFTCSTARRGNTCATGAPTDVVRKIRAAGEAEPPLIRWPAERLERQRLEQRQRAPEREAQRLPVARQQRRGHVHPRLLVGLTQARRAEPPLVVAAARRGVAAIRLPGVGVAEDAAIRQRQGVAARVAAIPRPAAVLAVVVRPEEEVEEEVVVEVVAGAPLRPSRPSLRSSSASRTASSDRAMG